MSGRRARRGSPKARAAEAAVELAYGERGECNRAAEERSCRAWQQLIRRWLDNRSVIGFTAVEERPDPSTAYSAGVGADLCVGPRDTQVRPTRRFLSGSLLS